MLGIAKLELFSGLISTLAKRATSERKATPSVKSGAGAAPIPLDTEAQAYFGKRVRELREAADMTQAELGRLVGMAQTRLPPIEQGQRDLHLSTMRRFARALGVPLRELLPPD